LSHPNSPKSRKSLNSPTQKGFTLVELIVSMAIAGVLMVGLSTFFASTFHNLFQAQTENANTERQYAVNQILADKMSTIKTLVSFDPASVLTLNQNTKNQLPFTYISKISVDGENYLGFKDMLPFNKIIKINAGAYAFGDSGSGQIKNAAGGTNPPFRDVIKYKDAENNEIIIKNFAGFAKVVEGTTDYFYIAVPDQNLILKCEMNKPDICSNFGNFSSIGGLNMPMDVETGKNKTGDDALFISDSGNNRIIQYNLTGASVGLDPSPFLAVQLAFPTGLAYDSIGKTLFFSDTFNHKVQRYNFSNFKIETVVGEGESDACDNTAKLCKLNLPTGLFADTAKNELYIADSGNDRMLKVSDPGTPTSLEFKFNLSKNYALDRIELSNGGWTGGIYDETVGNLIGNATHYSSSTKTFSNPDRLTAFSTTKCPSQGDILYVNEDISGMGLASGDKLKIGSSIYTYVGTDRPNCKEAGEGVPDLYKTKITLSETTMPAIVTGTVVYFSNPSDVVMQIVSAPGKEMAWTGNGFLTTVIKTYDISTGLAETDYQPTRVGDGILGTEEDAIQPIAYNDGADLWVVNDLGVKTKIAGKNIKFPTGASNAYVTNTIGKEIIQLSVGSTVSLKPIVTNFEPKDYDYVNDFPLESVLFSQFNGDKILEVALTTLPDPNGNKQVYTHDAILSP
jgi:prepilin-type N-terminal cleavage/methylation domain-containing protein